MQNEESEMRLGTVAVIQQMGIDSKLLRLHYSMSYIQGDNYKKGATARRQTLERWSLFRAQVNPYRQIKPREFHVLGN